MMEEQPPRQSSLFYMGINLEKRVRRDHVLREVAGAVDFGFMYGEVRDFYGSSGHVSTLPLYIEHAVFARAIMGAGLTPMFVLR